MKRLPQAPRGLLLDFGGVVVIATTRDGWQGALAAEVAKLLRAHVPGSSIDLARIEADLIAGSLADSRWKDAMSRPAAPAELTYEQFWGDFVAADWPRAEASWVREHAKELCRTMGELRQQRRLRTGLVELLDRADAAGIPVGIVSNALMGDVHRSFLAQAQLQSRFAAQIYSDEARVRKPNPELIHQGAQAIGLTSEQCWYVGDNYDRDVLCGRRAGAGAVVLVEAPDTRKLPYVPVVTPDLELADIPALTCALEAALEPGSC